MPRSNEHDMRKAIPTATVVMALLIAVVVLTHLANLGRANPYSQARDSGTKAAPTNIKPPVILIFSPENNAQCNGTNISLNFSVSAGAPGTWINKIAYVATWQEKTTYVNLTALNYTLPPVFSVNFRDVPEGNQSIFVLAEETGTFYADLFHYYHFYVSGVSSVRFNVDVTPPIISVSSSEKATYVAPDVPLNFTVNGPVSRISYALDGQDNVTISGNVTLYGLPNGVYNVTLYAEDVAGNVGASETLFFTVAKPEPFPATPVAAASAATVAVVGAGLLVYFRKRNR